jgi:nucleoside phosphorylase
MASQQDIDHQVNLLAIHRRNLAHYIKQRGLLGEAFAPPMVINGIISERDNIRRIKGILRGWGQQVDDHADDEEAPIAAVTPPTATSDTTPAAKPRPKQPRRRPSRGGPDVYISYNDADEAWVSETLLPRLEAAGLTAILDYRDFEIGVPKLVNVERAVERSRHTLIVITPAWIADEWNGFQSLLAASDDPSGLDRKLIPLILKPADLPRRLAYLEPADLTNPARREAQMERLVRSLAQARDPQKANSNQPSRSQPATPAQPQLNASVSAEQRPVDFVIVTALEEEREAVLRKLPGYRRHDPSAEDIRFYYSADVPVTAPGGAKGAYRVVVLSLLGMGRVQAATATADAIRQWNPRYVLLIGIAGGLARAGVKIGDILISDQIADYELQKLTPEGPEIRWQVHRVDPRLVGAVQNFNTAGWQDLIAVERPDDRAPKRHFGTIVTGDKVIAVEDVLAKYSAMWPKLIGVEMEAGGAAAAAFQSASAPGFFMVRGVSDLADAKKNSARVKKWRSYACEVAAAYAIALLQSGPVPLET